jgi:hypothetical protein
MVWYEMDKKEPEHSVYQIKNSTNFMFLSLHLS